MGSEDLADPKLQDKRLQRVFDFRIWAWRLSEGMYILWEITSLRTYTKYGAATAAEDAEQSEPGSILKSNPALSVKPDVASYMASPAQSSKALDPPTQMSAPPKSLEAGP